MQSYVIMPNFDMKTCHCSYTLSNNIYPSLHHSLSTNCIELNWSVMHALCNLRLSFYKCNNYIREPDYALNYREWDSRDYLLLA